MTIEPKHSEFKLDNKLVKPLGVAGGISFAVTANVTHFHFLTVTGISLPNDNPGVVLATVRAPNNDNPQFSDSFAVTVNQIQQQKMVLKIWRVDSSQNPSAAISIDVLVIP